MQPPPSNKVPDSNASAVPEKDPNTALSECLFSQYYLTLTGVGAGTGYAIVKKPPNGIAIMMVAGAAGTFLDLAYGWSVACRSEVRAWQEVQQREREREVQALRREE